MAAVLYGNQGKILCGGPMRFEIVARHTGVENPSESSWAAI